VDSTVDDVDRQVQAAMQAGKEWGSATPSARSLVLLRLADLVERRARRERVR
jgi:acyl-CoA reductase-like NAD-dependent aldehyde dehydrogenase